MTRQIKADIDEVEELEASVEGMVRHLAAHMKHDTASYVSLTKLIGRMFIAIAGVAEMFKTLRDSFAGHTEEDKKNHGILLGELDHAKDRLQFLIRKYYDLLNEREAEKEKEIRCPHCNGIVRAAVSAE